MTLNPFVWFIAGFLTSFIVSAICYAIQKKYDELRKLTQKAIEKEPPLYDVLRCVRSINKLLAFVATNTQGISYDHGSYTYKVVKRKWTLEDLTHLLDKYLREEDD